MAGRRRRSLAPRAPKLLLAGVPHGVGVHVRLALHPVQIVTRDLRPRLAAVLPAPRRYSVARPGPFVQRRANWIQRQVRQIGGPAYLQTLD